MIRELVISLIDEIVFWKGNGGQSNRRFDCIPFDTENI